MGSAAAPAWACALKHNVQSVGRLTVGCSAAACDQGAPAVATTDTTLFRPLAVLERRVVEP